MKPLTILQLSCVNLVSRFATSTGSNCIVAEVSRTRSSPDIVPALSGEFRLGGQPSVMSKPTSSTRPQMLIWWSGLFVRAQRLSGESALSLRTLRLRRQPQEGR